MIDNALFHVYNLQALAVQIKVYVYSWCILRSHPIPTNPSLYAKQHHFFVNNKISMLIKKKNKIHVESIFLQRLVILQPISS